MKPPGMGSTAIAVVWPGLPARFGRVVQMKAGLLHAREVRDDEEY